MQILGVCLALNFYPFSFPLLEKNDVERGKEKGEEYEMEKNEAWSFSLG